MGKNKTGESNAMVSKSVFFSKDQIQFLEEVTETEGRGAPSQVIRIALDKEIERRKANNSNK